jgi:hypothetical protein
MNETAITKTLYALERPKSDEDIEQLNTVIGKYLDNCTGKLNYSFWNTVIYTYWNFINLTKLCALQYDSNEEDFIKKIRDIVRQRLTSSPKLPVYKQPVYTQAAPQTTVVQSNTHVTPEDSSSDSDSPNDHSPDSPPYTPPNDNIPDDKPHTSKWFGTTVRRVAGGVAAACIIFFVYKFYSNSQEY